MGQVVHSAVQTLTTNLAKNGCQSALDERAVALFTELGGLSQIIRQTIGAVFKDQSDNPRGVDSRKSLREAVERNIPALREQVQVLLSRLHLGKPTFSSNRDTPRVGTNSYAPQKSFSEKELRDSGLGWVGVADFIGLSEHDCEIIDFKTGEPDEDHKLQILIYALLWASDKKANPTARLADKLTISYRTGPIDVPAPSAAELARLKEEITNRTQAAHDALHVLPPEARPSAENCTRCDVRQLCAAYWSPQTIGRLSDPNDASEFQTDLEVKLVSPQAMKCWNAIVVSSQILPPDSRIILRTAVFDNSLDEALLSGAANRLRILSARLTSATTDGSPALVSMSERSEGFLVR